MAKKLTKSLSNSSVLNSSQIRDLQSQPLPGHFYSRNTVEVACDLLGKIVIVDARGLTAGRIVEVEAYGGDDPASHASRGRTARTLPMFENPGYAYIYFIYGMYEMLNFVTEPHGQAGAVLIRAIEPLYGHDLMTRRRKCKTLQGLASGPGKLARALGIRMTHNLENLQGPRIWVADDGFKPARIAASPRVGISVGKETPWRFLIHENEFVSRAPQDKEIRVL